MTQPNDKLDDAARIGSGYRDWEWAARRLGEMMSADGPKGYYQFTPEQLVEWASSLQSVALPETQPTTARPARGGIDNMDLIGWNRYVAALESYTDQLERELAEAKRELEAETALATRTMVERDALERRLAVSAKQAHSKTEYKRLVAQGANVVLSDNAAPGSGGQQPGTTDSQESPAGERCPVAAPLSTTQQRQPFGPMRLMSAGYQDVFNAITAAVKIEGDAIEISVEKFLAAIPTAPLSIAPSAAEQELTNIANAERFKREYFENDTEFADWVQSRCRNTLALSATGERK